MWYAPVGYLADGGWIEKTIEFKVPSAAASSVVAPLTRPELEESAQPTAAARVSTDNAAASVWSGPRERLKMAAASGVESVVYAAIGFAGLWAGTWLTLVTNVPPAVIAVVPIIEWIWALTWLALSAIQMGTLCWRLAVSSIKEG